MSGTHRGLAGHVRRVTVEDWAFQQIGKKNRPASFFLLHSGGGGDTFLAMSDTKIHNGGPAFPVPESGPYFAPASMQGMSMRDWFAGQALAGLLACRRSEGTKGDWWAKMAYQQADAMLAARNAK